MASTKRKIFNTYTTIYTPARNVELVKLPGQVVYHMHRTFGYHATLVAYKNEKRYENSKEIPGVELVFLNAPKLFRSLHVPLLKYLMRKAFKIDILNLYHYNKQTFLVGLLYKIMNPHGFLYVDLDDDLSTFRKHGSMIPYSKNPIKKFLMKKVEWAFLNAVNLFSNGNKSSITALSKHFPELQRKLIYSPTGIDTGNVHRHIPRLRSFNEKENLIITVGRIGSSQKNTELLLSALGIIDPMNWRAALIGPVEDSFLPFFDSFISKCPQWKNRIELTGEVSDRHHLYQWYDKAKIFCLPSRYESFGIVLVEAMYFGNFVITSNVLSASDLTQGGTIGQIVSDYSPEVFAHFLTKTMQQQTDIEENFYKAKAYCEKDFAWNHIINKLHTEFTSH